MTGDLETSAIDRLFLELSQFTTARTAREIALGEMFLVLFTKVQTASRWLSEGRHATVKELLDDTLVMLREHYSEHLPPRPPQDGTAG